MSCFIRRAPAQAQDLGLLTGRQFGLPTPPSLRVTLRGPERVARGAVRAIAVAMLEERLGRQRRQEFGGDEWGHAELGTIASFKG